MGKTYARRLELLVLITWLVKDLSWVILLVQVAWPAALVAICLEFHSVLVEWGIDSGAVRAHGVAALFWLVGNATWMTSEFLWDASSSYKEAKRPYWRWHTGPLGGTHDKNYQVGTRIAESFFIAGLLTLASLYLACALGYGSSKRPAVSITARSNPQDEMEEMEEPEMPHSEHIEPLAWGFMTPRVHCMIYMGPWILKDLLWARELFFPALLCAVVAFALMADCYRRYRSPIQVVELNWVLANSIWLASEVGLAGITPMFGISPVVWLRLLAASFLAVGCFVAVQAYMQVKDDPIADARIEGTAAEIACLLGARDH